MADWGSYVDRQIQKAMEEGRLSNLPGEGKPLNLDDDKYTPEPLKLAHKILKDNDLAPEWMMMGKEVEAQYTAMMDRLKQAAAAYKAAQQDEYDEYQKSQAETAWTRAKRRFNADVIEYNRVLMNYNLRLPAGVRHRSPLVAEREINLWLGAM
jgi:hypothetical protein